MHDKRLLLVFLASGIVLLSPLLAWAQISGNCGKSYETENWADALKECKQEYDYATRSAVLIGTLYYSGKGDIADPMASKKEAAIWYQKVVDNVADPEARHFARTQLGLIMAVGAIPGGWKKACANFLPAARYGLLDAMYRMSFCYQMDNTGFDKDEKKALYWLEKAAEKGHDLAPARLTEVRNEP